MPYDRDRDMVTTRVGKMPPEFETTSLVAVTCPECGKQVFIKLTEVMKVKSEKYVPELPIDLSTG